MRALFLKPFLFPIWQNSHPSSELSWPPAEVELCPATWPFMLLHELYCPINLHSCNYLNPLPQFHYQFPPRKTSSSALSSAPSLCPGPWVCIWNISTYFTVQQGCLDLKRLLPRSERLLFMQDLLLYALCQGQNNHLVLSEPLLPPISPLKRGLSFTLLVKTRAYWE